MDDDKDMEFVNFISNRPVPVCLKLPNAAKTSTLAQKLAGNVLMYRLGHQVIRKRQEYVLRRIPAHISRTPGCRHLTYTESYNGDRANGFVVVADRCATIVGDDTVNEGFQELFLAQFDFEPDLDSLYNGVIAMIGDLDRPTAYRILIRPAPENDREMEWDNFVRKYQKMVPLTIDDTKRSVVFRTSDESETETGTKYSKYISLLHISSNKIDLRGPLTDDD
jgi:hypothetical protein